MATDWQVCIWGGGHLHTRGQAGPRPINANWVNLALHELRTSGFPRFWVSPTCLQTKLLWIDATLTFFLYPLSSSLSLSLSAASPFSVVYARFYPFYSYKAHPACKFFMFVLQEIPSDKLPCQAILQILTKKWCHTTHVPYFSKAISNCHFRRQVENKSKGSPLERHGKDVCPFSDHIIMKCSDRHAHAILLLRVALACTVAKLSDIFTPRLVMTVRAHSHFAE